MGSERTDEIQFQHLEFGARFAEKLLRGLAVRTVGFGEDGDGVVVDDLLGFGLGGGHAVRAHGARGEEFAKEGNGGQRGWSLWDGKVEVLELMG